MCQRGPLCGEQEGMEGRTGEELSPRISQMLLLPHLLSASLMCVLDYLVLLTHLDKVQKAFALFSPGLVPLLQLYDEFWFGKGNSYSQEKKAR